MWTSLLFGATATTGRGRGEEKKRKLREKERKNGIVSTSKHTNRKSSA